MPILNVKVAAAESTELAQAIGRALSELTARVLGKKPEVTAVAVQFVRPEHWLIDGESLASLGLAAYYFDIRITDETNTKAEKARYIAEAHALFSQLLGKVHAVSYIHVEDVRAAAYGYGGLTQEYRYHQPAV